MKVRPGLQWRPQGVGDARPMGSVPRSVVAWIGANLAEDILAESNRAGRGETPPSLCNTTDELVTFLLLL